jgi:hypothetical protein
MAVRRISTADIKKCFEAGLGVCETARKLECTKGAISKRAKALGITLRRSTPRENIIKDVTLYHAGEIVTKEINAIDQLYKVNSYANELLDVLMKWMGGDDEVLQILESQVSEKKIRVGKVVEFVKEYKFKDPRELALKAMGEIREQLKLQFEMMKALYDMDNVAAFQDEVLTTIGEVEPDVRKRIIEKLKERRIIRSVVTQN